MLASATLASTTSAHRCRGREADRAYIAASRGACVRSSRARGMRLAIGATSDAADWGQFLIHLLKRFAMHIYWLSWTDSSEDYRPLTDPPTEAVLGWWVSGECDAGMTLCAAIAADSEEEAKATVFKNWPESGFVVWRFCDKKPKSWRPGSRFRVDGWCAERLAAVRLFPSEHPVQGDLGSVPL